MVKRPDGTEALDMSMDGVHFDPKKDSEIAVFPLIVWLTAEEETYFFGTNTAIDPRPLNAKEFNAFLETETTKRRIAYAREKFQQWADEFGAMVERKFPAATGVKYHVHVCAARPYPE